MDENEIITDEQAAATEQPVGNPFVDEAPDEDESAEQEPDAESSEL